MTTREFILSAWNVSPVVALICIAAVALHVWRFGLSSKILYLLGSLTAMVLVVSSPLATLAKGFSFSAHMTQHMILLLIVPMLLVLSLPLKNLPGWVSKLRLPPWVCWACGVGSMWIWHEHTLCDLASRTDPVRNTQFVSLVILGTFFWWPLLRPNRESRINPLLGVFYLFTACVGCSLLGILITFAPAGGVCPIYLSPPHNAAILDMMRSQWGLSASADQQLGGLIMWVPGCLIYLMGAMGQLFRWYRPADYHHAAASAH